MLKTLTDLNEVQRIELVSGDVIASGYQGSVVTVKDATKKAYLTDALTDGPAYFVWTEGNRDGTQGFTPDTSITGKISCIAGRFRALTDQVTGYDSLSVGDSLGVAASGKLAAATIGTDQVVAHVVELKGNYSYLGTTYSNVVEIQTV